MTTHALQTATATERRHLLWMNLFYLFAVILPGGSLLILLRWLYLRLHL